MPRKLLCAFEFLRSIRLHYSFRSLSSSHTFPELFFGVKEPLIQSPRRRRLGPYEFLSFLKLEKDPDRLVNIFKEASEHPRFHHHRSAYESTVKKLATAGRPDAVEEILEHEKQQSRSRPYNEGFMVRIITLYGRAGMPDQAVKTFRQLPDFDCEPSVKCFNAALCALYAAKQHERMLDLYSEIETLNVKPNVTTFLTVIKALCKVGSSNSAYSMLDEMVRHGCSPDTVTFNAVLKGFYNEGKPQEAAMVLKKMSQMGCYPDVNTYNIRILNLCNESKSAEAKALLRVMRAEGIKPNALCYNTLIEGFCKEHNLVEANRVFVDMAGNECDPNNQSYYAFIYYLCIEEEFDWALEVCDESMRKNWVPDISVMQMLVQGLVKISKVDSACRIIGEARSRFPSRCVGLWDDIEKALSEVSGARRDNSSGK